MMTDNRDENLERRIHSSLYVYRERKRERTAGSFDYHIKKSNSHWDMVIFIVKNTQIRTVGDKGGKANSRNFFSPYLFFIKTAKLKPSQWAKNKNSIGNEREMRTNLLIYTKSPWWGYFFGIKRILQGSWGKPLGANGDLQKERGGGIWAFPRDNYESIILYPRTVTVHPL